MMRPSLLIVMMIACFSCGGCSHNSCADMRFREFEKADRIVVKQMSKVTLETIADPSRISQITRFIEAHDKGWKVPFGGTPVGSISMEFYSGAEFLGDFGIGQGFAEAQGCGYFFSRQLNADDRRQLAKLMGITDNLIQ